MVAQFFGLIGGGKRYVICLQKLTSHIEIFDAREKEVSVLSLALTEQYVSFGWEPKEGW